MNPIFLIFPLGVLAIVIEKFFPRVNLPYKRGWICRALTLNAIQLLIVELGGIMWERQLFLLSHSHSSLDLRYKVSPVVGGLIAYLVTTWVFYWWHRVRHENFNLWLMLHQLHHSPERLEVITSFYKHPLEIFCNSVIMGVIVYPILGLDYTGNSWLSVFSAFSEFYYHLNISTPRWLGFLIQSPEAHIEHHKEDRIKCKNYADLWIWDWLGGTSNNPVRSTKCRTGFSKDREQKFVDMLKCKDVLYKRKLTSPTKEDFLLTLVFVIGMMSMIGFMFEFPALRAIGFMTGASPLPLVFSAYNGKETFSNNFTLVVETSGTVNNDYIPSVMKTYNFNFDNKLYSKLEGPYNRKNMYGAMFSHGVFFEDQRLIDIRTDFIRNVVLKKVGVLEEFGIPKDEDIHKMEIISTGVDGSVNKIESTFFW